MERLVIGSGRVQLFLPQCPTSKDKRRVLQSLLQRLRRQGFSAVECGLQGTAQRAVIGFSYAGVHPQAVDHLLDEAIRLFACEATVIDSDKEVFDYGDVEITDSEVELPY